MGAYQDRVIAEHAELKDRLGKLKAFFETPVFAGIAPAEQTRLRRQAKAMSEYEEVLDERVKAFRE